MQCAAEIASSNKNKHLPTTDRVFYTTAPQVKGVKALLHEELRKKGQGHLLKTHKPGEPRKIIVKALPKNQYDIYLPKKGEGTKGSGASKITNTTFSRNYPSVSKSLPCDKALGCIDNILNDPVVPCGPFHKKKRKRKRKKNREPVPIQHESKDINGKNKSTKQISPPPLIVSGSSPASNHPATSRYSSPRKAPGPSNELSDTAETTIGSFTQTIFRGISYRGDQGFKSCFNLSCSSDSSISNDMDVLLVPSTPPPITFPHQINLIKTADVGKKRSAKEVHIEVGLKRARETGRDEGVISVKETSFQTEKQHDKSNVVKLENHMKRNYSDTGTSGASWNKNTDKAQLHEISCTEADVSFHLGVRHKVHHKERRDIVSKFCLSQRREKDSHDESENSDTPVNVRFKKKLPYPQKDRLSVYLSNNASECNNTQECQIIDQECQIIKHIQDYQIIDIKDSGEEDDLEEEKKSASHCSGSPVCGVGENISAVGGVEIQNEKCKSVLTSALKQKNSRISCKRLLSLSTGDRITVSEETVCGHTSIPETSESSVDCSSNSDLGNVKIEKTASVYNNKVLTEQRDLKENPDVSVSEVIENNNKGLMKQSGTAEEQSGVPSSNPSVSSDLSSISSASTEMLQPVGKTCLQNVVFVLHNHFGGTLGESFEVLQRNSFNLLTTIQELQMLHLPVEEALCSELEDECCGERNLARCFT